MKNRTLDNHKHITCAPQTFNSILENSVEGDIKVGGGAEYLSYDMHTSAYIHIYIYI